MMDFWIWNPTVLPGLCIKIPQARGHPQLQGAQLFVFIIILSSFGFGWCPLKLKNLATTQVVVKTISKARAVRASRLSLSSLDGRATSQKIGLFQFFFLYYLLK
jgi:hypothetical protein